MAAADPHRRRAGILAELLARPVPESRSADPNRPLFASILAGQAAGFGCLPGGLGLGEERHARLLASYFPGDPPPMPARGVQPLPELDDLRTLLLDHRAADTDPVDWMVGIVATACAGADHLWQDLGLADRGELNRLMRINFPGLAAANRGDMKWKKFLYRQICEREGLHACPVPSCAQCTDYFRCFGPER